MSNDINDTNDNEHLGADLGADDTALLDELLEYLDVFIGVLDLIHETLGGGGDLVKLEDQDTGVPPLQALDNAGLDLTRKTMQIRAKRVLYSGASDGDGIDNSDGVNDGEAKT